MSTDEANSYHGGGGADGVELGGGNGLVNGEVRKANGFGADLFENLFSSVWGKAGFRLNDNHASGSGDDDGNDSDDVNRRSLDGGVRNDRIDRIDEAGPSGGVGSGLYGVDLVVDLNSCEKRKVDPGNERRSFALSVCGNNVGLGMNGDGRKRVKEVRFLASDLVWGKARSHPWWPGQIFEPWDASEQAKKHFKSNTYLVAYYGDQTFAWNEETKLKPFWPFFSQMSKQGDTEPFWIAVDCVLEEAYRRVEFAMSCRCLGDTFGRVKTQIVENAGIREESCVREGGDRFFTADSFEPVKFLPYFKALALLPEVELDKLEVIMARALLSVFYRKKGYYNMAKFTVSAPIFEDLGENLDRKSENLDVDSPKLKPVSVDVIGSGKRQRRLADLMIEAGREGGGRSGSSATKKRRVDESLHFNSETKDRRRRKVSAGLTAEDTKHSSIAGESIRRIARKLSRDSKVKRCDSSSGERNSEDNDAGSVKSQRKRTIWNEHLSADEMLFQLLLAARDSLQGYDIVNSMVAFFSEFRNSVVNEDPSHGYSAVDMSNHKCKKILDLSDKTEDSEGNTSRPKLKRKSSSISKGTGKAENGFTDPSWTERITGEAQAAPDNKNDTETIGNSANLDGAPTTSPDMVEDVERAEGTSPTAMILNFSDSDSIPSEDKLNEIFRRYGSLLESETEVLRKSKRAKVVFTRVSDAETAFSSSGKFKTFGPSLNSYRLNYKPVLR
ncbi:PWWP domain-containing protein [Drosera capensis]